MPRQLINIGAAPNDNTGDYARDAGAKINQNFMELWTQIDTNTSSIDTLTNIVNAGGIGGGGGGGGGDITVNGKTGPNIILTAADIGASASGHLHSVADITNLQLLLNNKADLAHSHAIETITGLNSALNGKAALSHTHTLANITDAGNAASKNVGSTSNDVAAGNRAVPTGGTTGQVLVKNSDTNFDVTWATSTGGGEGGGSIVWDDILNKPETFAPSTHSHSEATTSVAGFMSGSDKQKLDGITAGAQPNLTGSALITAIDSAIGGDSWQDANLVSSVNGQTGTVVITAASINAAPTTHTHEIADVNGLNTALTSLSDSITVLNSVLDRSRLDNNPDLSSLSIENGLYFIDDLSGTVVNPFPTTEYGLYTRDSRANNRILDRYFTLGENNFGREFFRVYTGADGLEEWSEPIEYLTTQNGKVQVFDFIVNLPPEDTENAGPDLESIWQTLITAPSAAQIVQWSPSDTKAEGSYVKVNASGQLETEAPQPAVSTKQQLWLFPNAIAPANVYRDAWLAETLAVNTGVAAFDGHNGWHQKVTTATNASFTLTNIYPGQDYILEWVGAGVATPPSTNVVPTVGQPATWSAGVGKSLFVSITNHGTLADPVYRFSEIKRDA